MVFCRWFFISFENNLSVKVEVTGIVMNIIVEVNTSEKTVYTISFIINIDTFF